MWSKPSVEELMKIPKIYEQDGKHTKDKIVYGHFFVGANDWFITEFDSKDTFFGYAILNNDLEMAEWGYISFQELIDLKVGGWMEVDWDKHWEPKKICEIDKMKGGCW